MQITNVDVNLKDSDQIKAIARIVFDDAFIVKDIKIIKRPDKLIIAMPSRPRRRFNESEVDEEGKKKSKWDDIAHPINAEARNMIEKAIFDEYYKKLEEANQAGNTEA